MAGIHAICACPGTVRAWTTPEGQRINVLPDETFIGNPAHGCLSCGAAYALVD